MAMASLYRRSLPSPPAVDFASAEGKKLFKEAVQKGTMEGYFSLISYFQTQSEPAFCGLASLSMVLNALDSQRKWKGGSWKWFDESTLDCCESLEIVKEKGVTFGKLVCLAHCSGAKVEAFRTSQCTIDDFRKFVITCSSSEKCHIISSYDRGVFKQTGSGHFSPIGGYNAEKDMVLILDVARFKYPPHWVPITLLWEAMDSIDQSTGKRRGFMLVSRLHIDPGSLYTLSCKDESWMSIVKYLKEDVPQLVSSQHVDSVEKILSLIFKSLPSNFNQFIKWVGEIRRPEDAKPNLSMEEESRQKLKRDALTQVHGTELYMYVSKFLTSVGYEESLSYAAATACCQGAQILSGSSSRDFYCRQISVKCIKGSSSVEEATVICGVVVGDGSEQKVDLLVPSTQPVITNGSEYGPETKYPSCNEVFTSLLLALPPQTWLGIKDQALQSKMKKLLSVGSLSTTQHEEVSHLRRQLLLLKRCQENKEEEDLTAPPH
ncbi:Glutathione gamma-glutamylcysteinyltransferase 1 [Cardamine amara subsp. amara]|uniref:glutathione gamma-glutamylcysteinyltransferase n=1 Tax=Cardamine amara subsp. amara TaxID=228776 RepID=A0ABD1A720_CARAN